jgi:hypothetical protein
MSDYIKATNFATKDTLSTGNPNKIIKGTEIDTEFNAIASAVASKSDINSPTFTGIPEAPTAAAGTNTTQVATAAHVFAERTNTSTLTNKTLTSPTINTPTINTPTISGGSISGITDLAVADGGTGASTLAANNVLLGNGTSALQTVAPSTNGNVLTSNGTTWISAAPPSSGVTSLNGQTGAITNTGLDALGSNVFDCQVTTSGYLAGSTIAGSNLYRANTIVSYNGANIVSNGNNNGLPPFTLWYADYVSRSTTGNVGLGVPQGASNLSGTWRSMASISRATSGYNNEDNRTDANYGAGLWVRVS